MNPVSDISTRQRPTSDPLPAGQSPTDRTGEGSHASAPSPPSPVRHLPDQLAARRANRDRADEQAATCQVALAHGDRKADEPDAGDFLRQQLPAARQKDHGRVRVYGLCAKRAFRAEQARVRALGPVPPPDDLPPIAA